MRSFSIRSFGSWGEADVRRVRDGLAARFSIRSFGSWGEAAQLVGADDKIAMFQYPLFRIVG